MSKIGLLGELEQLVLLAILRLGEEAYAVAIRQEIRERTGLRAARGAVYVILDRLEKKGLLTSWFSEPLPERGGKARRYFKLEPPALEALSQARGAMNSMWEGLEPEVESI